MATAKGRTAIVVALLLALSSGVSAHHSATMFEQTKTITVEGVVKEFQYSNPHSWLLVDVKDKTGKVTTWGFEAEGPSTMLRVSTPFRRAISAATRAPMPPSVGSLPSS